ncbi:MAG: helix-turn-helix domain-containing protein [Oscillospiraceae bacterium]|jgi:repressor LexA|nr:helix-turn-helix domain-containing protein [Oscillospiraceae bacterium]
MGNVVGKKIYTLRKSLDYTLAELGGIVGVGASTVRKWEMGFIKDMRSDKVQKVADALQVSPSYLMGWDDQPRVSADNVEAHGSIVGAASSSITINNAAQDTLNMEEVELIRVYRSVSVKRRHKLLTFAFDMDAEEHNV